MTAITLGQIAEALTLLVGLFTGIGYLHMTLKKWLKKIMDEQTKSIDTKIDELNKRLDLIDLETTKNYLVQFISEVKRGETISETERQRFYEQYEHYLASGGNTYIRTEVEALQKKGYV